MTHNMILTNNMTDRETHSQLPFIVISVGERKKQARTYGDFNEIYLSLWACLAIYHSNPNEK